MKWEKRTRGFENEKKMTQIQKQNKWEKKRDVSGDCPKIRHLLSIASRMQRKKENK